MYGELRDEAAGTALPFVTIRAENTDFGAISTRGGRYLLRLPPGEYTLLFSFVGYQRERRTITLGGDSLELNLTMRPAVVEKAEIIVTAEDPGMLIMRQAIERKMAQHDSLKSYTYDLYTKFIAATDTTTAGRVTDADDTTIVAILESYSKGYFRAPDRYFNEIYQRRQSANIPPASNFVAFGTNLNAYDDYVTILGEEIATPFHPDALEYYDFKLEERIRASLGSTICRISVKPKADRRLFHGTIDIEAQRLIPFRMELYPNRAVQLPFDASLRFEQLFEEFEGRFIMPTGMKIESIVEAEILWIFSPRLDILIETLAYDYRFNPELPDRLFRRRRVESAPQAERLDSAFWYQNAVLPLRKDEEAAYLDIQAAVENPDSVGSRSVLDRIFGPITRIIAALNRKPFTGLDDVFRYNRIHGARAGIGMTGALWNDVDGSAALAYGFADKRWYGSGKLEFFADSSRRFSFDAAAYRSLARRDNPNGVGTAAITTIAMLTRKDYGDYYYADGIEFGLNAGAGQLQFIRSETFVHPSRLRIFARAERHRHAAKRTDWAVFGSPDTFRENPQIFDGNLRSFGFELALDYHYRRRLADIGFELKGEFSSPDLAGSDFNFHRFESTLLLRMPTLPLWMLDIRLSAGYAGGDVPPQRFFSPETSISSAVTAGALRGMQVKEFYGDRYLSLFVEHNFGELVPGILRIPNIASFGIEFLLNAGIGWTEFSQRTRAYTNTQLPDIASTPENLYYEAGVGINRILLFFRSDFSLRFSQTDSPVFFFTFGSATR